MNKTPAEIQEIVEQAIELSLKHPDRTEGLIWHAIDHLVDDIIDSVSLAALNALHKVLADPDTVQALIDEITGTVYDYYANHYDLAGQGD